MNRLKQFWKYLIIFILVFFVVDFGVFYMMELPSEKKQIKDFQNIKEILMIYTSKF